MCCISHMAVLSNMWFILWTLLSYEPPEWPASSWQGHACDIFQTCHSAAAQRRPWGPGPNKGLQQLTAASLQKARLQKLFQHLPTVCNAPPLQHTVSVAARDLVLAQTRSAEVVAKHVCPMKEFVLTSVSTWFRAQASQARGGFVLRHVTNQLGQVLRAPLFSFPLAPQQVLCSKLFRLKLWLSSFIFGFWGLRSVVFFCLFFLNILLLRFYRFNGGFWGHFSTVNAKI